MSDRIAELIPPHLLPSLIRKPYDTTKRNQIHPFFCKVVDADTGVVCGKKHRNRTLDVCHVCVFKFQDRNSAAAKAAARSGLKRDNYFLAKKALQEAVIIPVPAPTRKLRAKKTLLAVPAPDPVTHWGPPPPSSRITSERQLYDIAVCNGLNISFEDWMTPQPHREFDVVQRFPKMLNEISADSPKTQIRHILDQVAHTADQVALLNRLVAFGKHKGKIFRDLLISEQGYINWIKDQVRQGKATPDFILLAQTADLWDSGRQCLTGLPAAFH